VLVFMANVEEPAPVIDGGLNPPLVIPLGNPFSLPTLRFTVPPNPLNEVTVTVKLVVWPGTTARELGVTVMSKSPAVGNTVIFRVGGLGSELPAASSTVNDTTYSPGLLNTTVPGF